MGGGTGSERDPEVVLTCLKQHQHQQQARAHGQVTPVLLYTAGGSAAGTASSTLPRCQMS